MLLGITFAQGGESTALYKFTLRAVMRHAAKHYPAAMTHLKMVAVACSDFTGGCQNAYESKFGAKLQDKHVFDGGLLVSSNPCALRGCNEHAMDSMVGPGKKGRSKIRARNGYKKEDICRRLRNDLRTWSRCMSIVNFDLYWHYWSAELIAGTLPKIGKQKEWVKYIEKVWLFKEKVVTAAGNHVELMNATWRSRMDRKGMRPTDNPAESTNRLAKAKLRDIRKDLPEIVGNKDRSSIPAVIKQFEYAMDLDPDFMNVAGEGPVHRLPPSIDMNLISGNESIRKHSLRLVSTWLEKVRISGIGPVHEVVIGSYKFYVMAGHCCDGGGQAPQPVTRRQAERAVSFLTLTPDKDRHETWLATRDFLNGKHLSWTALNEVHHRLHIARVDLRKVEASKSGGLRWPECVTCATKRDQALNHHECEAMLMARHLLGDPRADPTPSAITTSSRQGRPQPRVLGNAHVSEQQAEDRTAAKRRRTKDQSRDASRSKTPPRSAED